MKSDAEMVESILQKAHEKENRMKKTKKITAISLALTAAVCAAVGAGALLKKIPSTLIPAVTDTPAATDASVSEETEPVREDAAHAFSLLIASAAEAQQEVTVTPVEHKTGVKLPISGRLVIENASGLTDEQKNHRHNDLNNRLTREWQISADSYHVGGAESENYIGSLAVEGKFVVYAGDAEALEKIEVTCGAFGNMIIFPATENGKVPIMGQSWRDSILTGRAIEVSAQDYAEKYLNSKITPEGQIEEIGMYVNYAISEALLAEKELDPDLGYESFSDEIVFRALYRDGSESSYTVVLSFDESGALSANVK